MSTIILSALGILIVGVLLDRVVIHILMGELHTAILLGIVAVLSGITAFTNLLGVVNL